MPAVPEHSRVARIVFPRLPLPAILAFAVAGFGGALFLAYTSGFRGTETKRIVASASDVPVYCARAVPLDAPVEDPVARTISIAQALSATRIEARGAETGGEPASSEQALLSGANEELKGFSRFANFGASNTYLALSGSTFGISGQNAPGYFAPSAESESAAAVPEVSTWLCGAALLALVGARSLHAKWHRSQQRKD